MTSYYDLAALLSFPADIHLFRLAQGVPQADVIVCAMNLTEENREIFRYEVLKQAKPGAVFVNIARGELSPHNDLLRLLDEGRLGGVALDVYENEAELAVGLRSGSAGGNETVLSDTGREESPSFAPNGRWVMYATQAGGRDSLVAVSVDGRVRQRLTSSAGDIREPTWGPFAK